MNVAPHPHPLPDRAAQLHAALEPLMEEVIADLTALVRIPSIAWPSFDPAHVDASAEAVAGLARTAGFDEVEILRAPTPGGEPGAPAVVARRPAPAGAGTYVSFIAPPRRGATERKDNLWRVLLVLTCPEASARTSR